MKLTKILKTGSWAFAAILSLSAAALAGAGAGSSGGGHGVAAGNSVVFLDLEPSVDQLLTTTPIDFYHDAETSSAANLALQSILPLRAAHRAFIDAYTATFTQMHWAFTDQALTPLPDSSIRDPREEFHELQVARQDEQGNVVIDKNLFTKMDTTNRAALFLHETFLRRLGLKMPRPALRWVVRELLGTEASRFTQVEKALNDLNPHILTGEHQIEIKSEGVSCLSSSENPDCSAWLVYANHFGWSRVSDAYFSQVLPDWYHDQTTAFDLGIRALMGHYTISVNSVEQLSGDRKEGATADQTIFFRVP